MPTNTIAVSLSCHYYTAAVPLACQSTPLLSLPCQYYTALLYANLHQCCRPTNTTPLLYPIYTIAMSLPCQYYTTAVPLAWHCCHCPANTTPLMYHWHANLHHCPANDLYHRHAIAMSLLCHAIPLPCQYHTIAVPIPHHCRANTTPLPYLYYYCFALTMPLQSVWISSTIQHQ